MLALFSGIPIYASSSFYSNPSSSDFAYTVSNKKLDSDKAWNETILQCSKSFNYHWLLLMMSLVAMYVLETKELKGWDGGRWAYYEKRLVASSDSKGIPLSIGKFPGCLAFVTVKLDPLFSYSVCFTATVICKNWIPLILDYSLLHSFTQAHTTIIVLFPMFSRVTNL